MITTITQNNIHTDENKRFSLDNLNEISKEAENWTAQKILQCAIDQFGNKLAFATAFGIEGVVIMHIMSLIPGYDKAFLFNLETGYQFPETLALRDQIQEKLGLTVNLVQAKESVEEMEARFGGPIYGTEPDKCCAIRKTAPLKETLVGFDAWISAIRREQSPTRANAPIIGWDKKFDLVKINPLAKWTRKQVWNYAFENEVPYNPLYDQNYASIGCWPCTVAVKDGEDERAGRWAGTVKTECGIHVGSH